MDPFLAEPLLNLKIDCTEIERLQKNNGGRIPKGDKGEKIKRYIKNNPRFVENPPNEVRPILIKRSYCLFSLKNIEGFLKLLLENVYL